MKLTNFAIIFIIIITPYMLYNHYDSRRDITTSFQSRSYDNIIEKAINDATMALYMDTAVDENNRIVLNKEFAIDTFFETLAINFGYMDDSEIEYLKSYVPLIIIVDYDGVYTYSVEKYSETSGETVLKHVLHDKKYFTVTEGDNIIAMYLDGTFKILSTSKNRSFYGTYDEMKSISLSTFFDQPETDVNRIRKEVVNDVILNEMQRINSHNEFANINGVNYDFYIPAIEDDMKTTTIDNIGIIASIQGFPTGGGQRYSKFSIAINSIEETQKVYGYNDAGSLIYHEEGCTSMTGTLQEIFDSKIEAARNGYYPDYDCN